MVLIILHHYSLHGGLSSINSYDINKYIGIICLIDGKVAVNLFVLISGYFFIESEFKIEKVLKLILQVNCYSTLFFIGYVLLKGKTTIEKIKLTVFPFKSKSYWFILLYILDTYIRLYDLKKVSKKSIKWICIIGCVVFIIVACSIAYMSKYNSSLFRIINKISSLNSIVVLIETILIFLVFNNTEIKSSKFINLLGKSSVGVYLLHDSIFRVEFWKEICFVEKFYFVSPEILILHIVVYTLGIYLGGTVIESVRVKVIENHILDKKIIN